MMPRSIVGLLARLALLLAVGVLAPGASAQSAVAAPVQAARTLHVAALAGDVAATRALLRAGADVDARDAYGSTPLLVATTFGKPDVARALIEAGANLDLRNGEGSTALHVAAFLCRTEIVKMLLEHGANRFLRNHAGNTAWESVIDPFERVRPSYEYLGKALAPLGLALDPTFLAENRPRIAALLRPDEPLLRAVDFTPLPGDWPLASPAAEGLDRRRLAEAYLEAQALPNIDALLVLRHGHLVGEKYFNGASVDSARNRQSVTKSVVSALVGIARKRGCLQSLERKMPEFFPELAGRIEDPRKRDITVAQLMQMRAGYPWEEFTPPYMSRLYLAGHFHWLPYLVEFPLATDPGTAFAYSNLSSHLLGVIVSRACATPLHALAQAELFAPMGATVRGWSRDADGNDFGSVGLALSARDLARFGQLYLRDGVHDGRRLLPEGWTRETMRRRSSGIHIGKAPSAGRYFRDLGYGYQWWSATVGPHRVDFAWGHGGNLVALITDLDLMVVATADPLEKIHWRESWKHEVAVINLVGKLIASLPGG